MTLPASGPISISMVAAELGIGLPLSLGDSRVRALAGVPSGSISLGQLRGKSAYTPMTVTGNNDAQSFDSSGANGMASCSPSVSVTGGTGGYSYAWAFTSNPSNCTLANASSASVVVSRSYARNTTGSASATLQCTVTDNTGHSVTQGGVLAQLSWASSG